MPNPIPTESRRQVEQRDRRCVRCGGPGGDWHHRRGRAVRDVHQHCACNGVLLCRTCHDWAHHHPVEAGRLGLVVSRYEAQPGAVSVRYVDGWWALDCVGGASPT